MAEHVCSQIFAAAERLLLSRSRESLSGQFNVYQPQCLNPIQNLIACYHRQNEAGSNLRLLQTS